MHLKGIMHRDLSLNNIMVTKDLALVKLYLKCFGFYGKIVLPLENR